MNILIKLTCLVGLVIAPIIGEKIEASEPSCTSNSEMTCKMENCPKMSDQQCAKKCESKTCSSEQKANCPMHGNSANNTDNTNDCASNKKSCCKKP